MQLLWITSLWYGTTLWLVSFVSGKKDLETLLRGLEKFIISEGLKASSWPSSTAKLLWSLKQSLSTMIGGLLFSIYYVFVYVVLFRSFLQVLVDPTVSLMYVLVLGGSLCCGWILNCYFWGVYEWGLRRHGSCMDYEFNKKVSLQLLNSFNSDQDRGKIDTYFGQTASAYSNTFVVMGLAPFFLGCIIFGLALLGVLWGVASIPVIVGVLCQLILAFLIPRFVGRTWFSYLSKQSKRLDMIGALLDQYESAKLMDLVPTICNELDRKRVEEFTELEKAKYYLVLIQFLGSIIGAVAVWSGVFILSVVYVDSFTVANVSAGMVSVWIIGKSVWIFQGIFGATTTCTSSMKIGEEICASSHSTEEMIPKGDVPKGCVDIKSFVVSVQKARDATEVCSVCSKPVFNKADCLFVNGASIHASCLQKTKVSDLAAKSSKQILEHAHSLVCGVCSGAILEKDFLEINGVLFHLSCVDKLEQRPNMCSGCDKDDMQARRLCSKCKRKFCSDCLVPMSDGRNFCRRLCVSQFGVLVGPWSCTVEKGTKMCILGSKSLQANAVLLRSLITGKDVVSGSSHIGGRTAICFEQVFVMPQCSIKENIIFGRSFDSEKYDTVIQACALDIDFATFIDQDQTKILENGANLSGGQMRRVGLARALYADADVIFFEDPFQGLDQKTARHFLREGIFGVLKEKTVIISSSLRVQDFDEYFFVHESGLISKEERKNVEEVEVLEQEKSGNLAFGTEIVEVNARKPDEMMLPQMSTKDATLSFLRYCAHRFVWMCIFLLFEMGSGVAAFYLFSFWLNENILFWALLFLGTQVASPTIYFLTQMVSVRCYTKAGTELCKDFHFALTEASTESVRKWKTFASTTLSADVSVSDQRVMLNMLNLFRDVCVFIVAFIGVGIAFPYGVIAVPFIVVASAFLTFKIAKTVVFVNTEMQNILKDFQSSAILCLKGSFTSYIYGYSEKLKMMILKKCSNFSCTNLVSTMLPKLLSLSLEFIAVVFASMVVMAAAGLRSSMNTTFLVVILLSVVQLTDACFGVMNNYLGLTNSLTNFSRLFQLPSLLEREKTTSDEKHERPQSLTLIVKDVCVSYNDGEKNSVENVSFSAKCPSKLAIIGRTGAGKSTLLKGLLSATYRTSGEVKFGGLNLQKEWIFVVPQTPMCFPGTVRENLLADTTVVKDGTLEQLVKEFIGDYVSLEDKLGHASEVSLNVSRSIGLIRACLRRPHMIFVDEAIDNLQHLDLLKKYCSESIVIVVVHSLDLCKGFDEILVMEKGHLVEKGDPRVLGEVKNSIFNDMRKK